MTKKLKTVPRLTLIFIISLVISGSILTYFSINNISNFKELTQKKISEEQEKVVEHFSAVFQEILEDITGIFDDSAKARSGNWAGDVFNTFKIDDQANFIRPWYIDNPVKGSNEVSSTAYIQSFNAAQMADLQGHDFLNARNNYQLSLKQSSNSRDSAQSLNRLARVFIKLKQEQKAYDCYSQLISRHYSSLYEAEFPFAYFAILRLLKLDIPQRDSLIFGDVSGFLGMMEAGKIPLNQSTPELLQQTEDWVRDSDLLNEIQKKSIGESVQSIKRMMAFVLDYSDVVRGSLGPGNKPKLPEINGNFSCFRGIEANNSDLILINATRDTASGFILELDPVLSRISLENAMPETEFEYVIDVLEADLANGNIDSDFVTIAAFSAFFPSHFLRVQLKNKNIVNEYVSRRSWIYGIALVLLLGGMLLGITLILSDIRRESKLALLRSDFVSNVTHELKTPLTSISMFAESIYLGGDLSESDQKKYSNVIIKESGNLKRMINNILSFSMREDGKQTYQWKDMDLSALITSTLEEFNYWLEKQEFQLNADIEDNIIVRADPEAFKQAISNLINNAIKYSPETKNLFVRLYKKDDGVYIEVEDTGIGIPQDQINKIFDKFYRVSSKDMESTSGTGIGLTVTRDIVEAHGGSISVSSVLNQGSTFKIYLKA